jgi:hypothetical protein
MNDMIESNISRESFPKLALGPSSHHANSWSNLLLLQRVYGQTQN